MEPLLSSTFALVYTMAVALYFRRLQVDRFVIGESAGKDLPRMLGCGAYYVVVACLVYGGIHELGTSIREPDNRGWAGTAMAAMKLAGILTLHLVHEFKMGRDPQHSDPAPD